MFGIELKWANTLWIHHPAQTKSARVNFYHHLYAANTLKMKPYTLVIRIEMYKIKHKNILVSHRRWRQKLVRRPADIPWHLEEYNRNKWCLWQYDRRVEVYNMRYRKSSEREGNKLVNIYPGEEVVLVWLWSPWQYFGVYSYNESKYPFRELIWRFLLPYLITTLCT